MKNEMSEHEEIYQILSERIVGDSGKRIELEQVKKYLESSNSITLDELIEKEGFDKEELKRLEEEIEFE